MGMPAVASRPTDARRVTRFAGVAGVLWGGLLLRRGRAVWLALDRRPPSEVDELATTVLGLRHLAQGGAQLITPDRFQRLFVAVDVLHALSMVALAAADERRRRPALVTGSAAAAAALLTVVARRRRA